MPSMKFPTVKQMMPDYSMCVIKLPMEKQVLTIVYFDIDAAALFLSEQTW